MVELLLDRDANINQVDRYIQTPLDRFVLTPLFVACRSGHEEVVKLLLARGADINQANDVGSTPLYVACYNGHGEVVELLLARGADINQATRDSTTPLSISCATGHIAISELLISSNKLNGYTPEQLKLIITSCVDDRLRGRANATPYSIIAYRCYKQLQLQQEWQTHMLFELFSDYLERRVERVLPEEVWCKVRTYVPLIGPSYTPSDQESSVIERGRAQQERQTHTFLSLFYDDSTKRVEKGEGEVPVEFWGKMTTYLPLLWLRNDDNTTTHQSSIS